MSDAVELARRLIACRSVTPADGGAQDLLADVLAGLGFTVTRLQFGTTPNLFARIGTGGPHLSFAGHTDVVPPGDGAWSCDPFAGEIRDDVLLGRGAVDMKGAIACFVAAIAAHLQAGPPRGTISLLITGDEEGPARDGTRRVVEWLRETGQMPHFCLVGEPTNPAHLGQSIKIGRRGSLNATITVPGIQGHSAYPERANNPIHALVALLDKLIRARLDGGTPHFAPSTLQVTSVDVGNPATNVIPARATARLNVRFNDHHTGASIAEALRVTAARIAPGAELAVEVSGEPFLGGIGPETEALQRVAARVTGREPAFETGGGTSDARFLAPFCRVAEFGLVGATMHQVDEQVPLADLRDLATIYREWLEALAA